MKVRAESYGYISQICKITDFPVFKGDQNVYQFCTLQLIVTNCIYVYTCDKNKQPFSTPDHRNLNTKRKKSRKMLLQQAGQRWQYACGMQCCPLADHQGAKPSLPALLASGLSARPVSLPTSLPPSTSFICVPSYRWKMKL